MNNSHRATRKKILNHYQFRTEFKVEGHSTELCINGSGFALRCYIANDLSARNRRQFLLSMYLRLAPLFELIEYSRIHHFHHINDFTGRENANILSDKQAINIDTSIGKQAYLIRGIRTKSGKTQLEFAKELGIEPTYLSKIEKGKKIPSRKLLLKIFEMKSASEINIPEALL